MTNHRTSAIAAVTTATVVDARAFVRPSCSWSHVATPFASSPFSGTGFGTNGMYGTKRPSRPLDEPLT